MTPPRLTTPFGATATVAEVSAGVDLTARFAIVTGAASGIGIETARALAHAGAHVTLAVRDLEAGHKAANDIGANTRVAALDLSDRASIAAFASAWHGPLHILVNTDFDWKTPAQGAATSVLLAASPLLDGIGGRYFEDCNEAEPNRTGSRRGVAAYALDSANASQLWEVSCIRRPHSR